MKVGGNCGYEDIVVYDYAVKTQDSNCIEVMNPDKGYLRIARRHTRVMLSCCFMDISVII